ncbi:MULTISPECIES: Nickel transporter NicT [Kitasatospora]|uniref:HoxN/HupN/NixA family nickel/cobalt transporter n=1 Tax=Kitasatospora TaxID=2063 RepID=UPI0004C3B119|nr:MULTISPECIES: HoxN/HupN/NixA family nickel/cobalt transporter [unclassified Kitasatospora]WAL71211.1 HoxN/HupN/NixA family nickel/cobalt transporter [Kitasatospora sp. YST-16]WNW37247.1 HoxN/HupN/NixA family nickel/cobalt transporter [Streptomyces sp. Li-HN-5-13]
MAAPSRLRDRLTREEWLRLAGMGGFVLLLHVVGWVTLLAVIAPRHYDVGGQVFGAGMGLTAYTLGMRHAFDADHIAAIDNTTRKLMGQGKRPLSVGFWFSLGHSSIVFGLCALLAFGIRSLAGQVESDDSTLHQATGLIGVSVSGTFLVLIGLINLGAFNGILKVFRKMRRGEFDEAELERQLDKRGFLNRILGRVTRAVTKPWHMYPVGLLFGLGFDTATEVSLLVLAGGAAAFALPWYALLVLPILFAAGMSLLDTIDGSFMNFAYEWAFSKPVRKIYYNLTVTGLSVVVALVIGVIELVGLLAEKLDITGGPIGWIGSLDLNLVGYVIVGLFVVTWAGALAFWKFGRVEQKWGAGLREQS